VLNFAIFRPYGRKFTRIYRAYAIFRPYGQKLSVKYHYFPTMRMEINN